MDGSLLTIILLVVFSNFLLIYSQERYGDLRIDCGAAKATPAGEDGLISWLPDESFISTGQNHLISYSQNFSTMNTLRNFPDGDTNCYNLPFYISDTKFLIRAGFYYGNYDGLNKPPNFSLEIDGNFWANVTTASTKNEPILHEMIYRTHGDSAQVCLVRSSDGGNGIPFISSLEATAFPVDGMYRLMENDTALLLHGRFTYGSNTTVQNLIDQQEDFFNRIWKPKRYPQYLNIIDNKTVEGQMYGENNPPWPVMQSAIQTKNVSDSIHLSVNFPHQISAAAYFVFYFRDPFRGFPKQSGEVEVFINNKKLGWAKIPPHHYNRDDRFSVVSLYPVAIQNGLANITISATENSTLPPLLNAMEVFYVVNVTNPNTSNTPYLLPNFFMVFLGLFVYAFY